METVETLSKFVSNSYSFIIILTLGLFGILVFNLANSIDEEESQKKLDELKKEAKESAKNKNRVNLLRYSL